MKSLWNRLARAIIRIRFKLFRLMSIIFLGRECGQSIIGQCVVTDLEFANTESARRLILERKPISEACVQTYDLKDVPDCWRAMFSRCAVFPKRYAYLLQDVAIGPESGVMFAPSSRRLKGDGMIFVPSIGHHYFLFQCGIQEVMRSPKPIDDDTPLCPMPVIGYYHDLLEGLLHVVIAIKSFENVKVIVPERRPRYIDDMLDFIGLERGRIIASDRPVLAKRAALVPRWSDCGENLRGDISEFARFLVGKLPVEHSGADKLYISRLKSRRSIPNEREVERVLGKQGFRVAYFEEMPFSEQLLAMRSAKVIVAPHGAALANLIAANPDSKVVEIMTQGWANCCYGHLASSLGIDYTCVDADDEDLVQRLSAL